MKTKNDKHPDLHQVDQDVFYIFLSKLNFGFLKVENRHRVPDVRIHGQLFQHRVRDVEIIDRGILFCVRDLGCHAVKRYVTISFGPILKRGRYFTIS